MTEQNNIDKIFKDASQQFSAPAPEKAWANINTSLKTTARYNLIRLWSIIGSVAAASLLIGFIVFNSFNTNNIDENIITNTHNIDNSNKPKNNKPASTIAPVSEISDNKTLDNNQIISKHSNTENTTKKKTDSNAPKNAYSKISIEKSYVNKALASNISSIDKTKKLHFESKLMAVEGKTSNTIDTKKYQKQTVKHSIEKNDNATITTNQNYDIAENKTLTKQEVKNIDIKTSESGKITNADINKKTIAENNTTKQENINIKSKDNDINGNDSEIAENKTPSKTKASIPSKTDFFIGQSFGITMANGVGKTPIVDNKKMGEAKNITSTVCMSANIDFGIIINKLKISAGLRTYNMQLKGDIVMNERNPKYINIEKYGFTELGYIKIINVNQIMRVRNLSSIVYLRNFNKYTITLEYYEIPLTISYELPLRNWVISPHIGINANYISSNSVMLEDAEGYFLFGEITDLKEYMIGGSIGTDLSYKFNKHWALGITTDFVYYPSSVSTSENFSFNPYSILSGIRMEYRL